MASELMTEITFYCDECDRQVKVIKIALSDHGSVINVQIDLECKHDVYVWRIDKE